MFPHFQNCIPLYDDEMGIAVIYWHTLSTNRAGIRPGLPGLYSTEMKVGHDSDSF